MGTADLAAEWAVLSRTVAEDRAALDALEDRLRTIEGDLRAELTVGEAVVVPGGAVVMAPRGKQPPSRVDSQGLSHYREQLLDLGLVREEVTLTRPKVSELRDKTPELIARGVDVNRIIVRPAQPVGPVFVEGRDAA
jgi:hypothetical protein